MIHPTAIVDAKAELADDVIVLPYSIIGANVHIDTGTWIGPHVVIAGPSKIGKDNRIYQFSSIGEIPQDKKYAGEATELIIGDRNIIRENCTFNRGTIQDKGKTTLGNDNWIMAYVHIAHDCIIGNNTVFANNATLAGHVTIKDHVILGGFTLVHQFCQIGEYAFTGMGTTLAKDLPPYVMAFGSPGVPRSINREGLRRKGFSAKQIQRIKTIYRILYRQEYTFQHAIDKIQQQYKQYPEAQLFTNFLKNSKRGVIR